MIRLIILFELRYWLRQPMLWGFLGLTFTFAFLFAVTENGGAAHPGMVHLNAPMRVYVLYSNLAFLWLPMVTAIVNATAIRDFAFRTSEIVFSTVVTRRQYLLGHFLGSTAAAFIPTLGISLGLVAGSWFPYGDPMRFGPNDWAVHAQAILFFGVTSILFQSAVMFAVASQVRSTAAAFVTAAALVVLNGIAVIYATDVDNLMLASFLDPFGVKALDEVTRYWSVYESNDRLLPALGPLTWNRLLWLGIAAAVFAFGYFRFSFTERRNPGVSKAAEDENGPFGNTPLPPALQRWGRWSGVQRFMALVRSDLLYLLRSPVFWIIIALCMALLLTALAQDTSMYGNHSWPVTYNVIDMTRGVTLLFLVVLITFYSGELVWRDRDANMDGITSALPVRSWTIVLAKYTVMIVVGLFLLLLMTAAGMGQQLVNGYTRLQPGLYFTYLIGPGLVSFAFWSAIALTVQSVVDHKYIGFGLFILLFVVNMFGLPFLKVESNLVILLGAPRLIYSDLNGFGPTLKAWLFFRTYWMVFVGILLFVAVLFAPRGVEDTWRRRLRIAHGRLKRAWLAGAMMVAAWLVLLGFGYYNTRILNPPQTEKSIEKQQAEYERTYKRFSQLASPYITAVDITVELPPGKREVRYHAAITLTNKGATPLDTLWFYLPGRMKMTFDIPGAVDVLNDSAHAQRMFRLKEALAPMDSLRIAVTGAWTEHGFTNYPDFVERADNGTFIEGGDLLPALGYQREMEMQDPGERREQGLPPRQRMALLSDDPDARRFNAAMEHTDRIRFACTIGTALDQTAVAPGTLEKEWVADGMRWFRYACDTPILDLWAILSARYAVAREQAGDVTLEVYHHPEHGINVPRMLQGMRDALAYASQNFGPYQHHVARIAEFPRYSSFARSLPGIMPYSEGIGFITDLRDTARIDAVYYVVAHEVAHQWWGHQVCGPRMQGTSMLIESMAQYTALMVMEHRYGRPMMRKFLKNERDNYLRARGHEPIGELPLMNVEGQEYIHYNKGSVVLYGLRNFLGEDRVNSAYRAFVDSFAFKGAPYPTTLDLYRSLETVTPDSLRYLLEDGLKCITFYRNALTSADAAPNPDGTWTVHAAIACAKLHTDSLGKETEVPMNDWIDVAITLDDGGETKRRVRLHSGENSVSLVTSHKPKTAVLDPDHLFFDREDGDDRRDVVTK